ncbi:MAG: hypothetical protein IKF99_03115 [Oscillospiraceae bacterium]|nr:hypothetical protein [Oscillospiraceae bacterium]
MLSDSQKAQYKRKREKLPEAQRWRMDCPVCHKAFDMSKDSVEYVKTKRGTELWIHTECVRKWGE